MNNASVGLIALWTGQLEANVSHMRAMAIHQMTDKELDCFALYVADAGHALHAISKYVTEQQENAE
jgi:hypothetical protein